MSSDTPTHTSQGVSAPGGPHGPQAVPPVYLTPLETSAQNDVQMPISGLPEPDRYQCYVHDGWKGIRSKVHASLIRTAQPDSRIKAFENCCRKPLLQFKGPEESTATEWRMIAERCHDRMCTPCAVAKSWEIREKLMNQLDRGTHKFITLTLFSKPEEPLASCIDRLYAGFKSLRRLKTWDSAVLGGVAFLEITRGDNTKGRPRACPADTTSTQPARATLGGRWHAHLHVIADATFISKAELSVAWRAATTDSYIVDIEVAGGQATARYVTKYVTKALHGSVFQHPELLDEFVLALYGRRLATTFGTWYGASNLEESELDGLREHTPVDSGWRSATIYTVEGVAAFLPPTVAGDAIRRLPFIRFIRTRPPPPGQPPPL